MRLLTRVPLVALALAPVLASAQTVGTFLGERQYAFAGCDYSYAEMFGPGPRACATSIVTVRDYFAQPSLLAFSVSLQVFTGYIAGTPTGIGFLPGIAGLGDQLDGVTFQRCEIAVCRQETTNLASPPGFPVRTQSGYTPTSVFVGGAYVPDSIPTRAPRFVLPLIPRVAASLTLVAVPEPSTAVLSLGGLAVLGAGAWRRRRA